MEGDWDGSIPQLEKALDRYPTSPRIRLDLAQAYFEVGDYRTTIRLLEEVKRYAIFDRDAMGVAVKVLGGPEVSERPVVEEGSSPLRGHYFPATTPSLLV
jgi:tetratricopeptide (TPR) repeat protein